MSARRGLVTVPPVIATSSEQTIPIRGVVQGAPYLLVLTNATAVSTLKFLHLDDPTPANHPAHTAVSGPTAITEFVCPAPVMTLVFATAPTSDYRLTVTPLTSPEF